MKVQPCGFLRQWILVAVFVRSLHPLLLPGALSSWLGRFHFFLVICVCGQSVCVLPERRGVGGYRRRAQVLRRDAATVRQVHRGKFVAAGCAGVCVRLVWRSRRRRHVLRRVFVDECHRRRL